ncbi:MAG: hypothetical protein ACYTX0_43570 [Nostoc sp.]
MIRCQSQREAIRHLFERQRQRPTLLIELRSISPVGQFRCSFALSVSQGEMTRYRFSTRGCANAIIAPPFIPALNGVPFQCGASVGRQLKSLTIGKACTLYICLRFF